MGTLIQGKRGTPNYKIKQMRLRDESKWSVVPHNHEPIVDEMMFELVQRMLQRDTRKSPEEETVQPLSGIVFCADCMRAMCRRVVKRGEHAFTIMCVPQISGQRSAAVTAFLRALWSGSCAMPFKSKLK